MFLLKQKLPSQVWWKIERTIFNTNKFSNHDKNKFVLLFQKGFYPYEYIGNCVKLKEISLPEKNIFSVTKYGRYYWYKSCASKKSL